ncbi:MAG: hypothetical protein OXP66_09845 [Candidatus Tectomicrobia bacterium]|nr:hypothetical protein [Candidatus Tectomicrobia bacterium]
MPTSFLEIQKSDICQQTNGLVGSILCIRVQCRASPRQPAQPDAAPDGAPPYELPSIQKARALPNVCFSLGTYRLRSGLMLQVTLRSAEINRQEPQALRPASFQFSL